MRLLIAILMLAGTSCSTLNRINPWSDDSAEADAESQKDKEDSDEEKVVSQDSSHQEKDSSNSKQSKNLEDGKGPGDKTEKLGKHERKKSKAASIEELEKNQAELWAKIDSLNMNISDQKQRVKVLEKAVTLGIVPDELRNDAKQDKLSSSSVKPKSTENHLATSIKQTESKKSQTIEDSKKDSHSKQEGDRRMIYEQKMASAQDYFRAGRYGRAIAEYSSVQKEYKDYDTQGSSFFWLAMSWLNMKEYQSAQKSFESFMEEYSQSPLAPRASFYLARVEFALGLKEKSQNRLRKIVADRPDDDAAEMARLELQQMKSNL